MPERWERLVPFFVALLLALGFAWVDRFGPAASHDSLYYLEGASYWLQTGTYSNMYWGSVLPEVHYAPLFSGLLAIFAGMASVSPVQISAWLMPLLAFVNLTLFGLLFQQARLGWLTSSVFVALIASSYSFFSIHWHIWSEPLYLSFLLGTVFMLQQWQTSKQGAWLWGAVLAAGLSVLVRYAGLFMFPALVLWMIFTDKSNRWRNSLLFSALALLPFVAWTIRNKIQAGALHSRKYFWDWAGWQEFRAAWEVCFSWTGLVIVALVGLFYLIVQKRFRLDSTWIWLLGSIVYVCSLVLAKSTIDQQIPLDGRMLSPLLVPAALLAGRLWQAVPAKSARIWLIIALAASLQQAYPFAKDVYTQGWSFNNQALFKAEQPIARIKAALPDSAQLFATDLDGHYLAYMLNHRITYHHFGDTLQPGGWYVRWRTDLPLEPTIRDAVEVVPDLVWHRKPLP